MFNQDLFMDFIQKWDRVDDSSLDKYVINAKFKSDVAI